MSDQDRLTEFLALVQTGAISAEEAAKLLSQGLPDDEGKAEMAPAQKQAFRWRAQLKSTVTGITFANTWDEAVELIASGTEDYTVETEQRIVPQTAELIEQVPLGSIKGWWKALRGNLNEK